MVVVNNKLDEMAILPVSAPDDLPFKVTIKSPDHLPPHAHVMDLATGKKELGQFLLSSRLSAKPEDIKDYKQGLTDEMRQAIFTWAKLPNMLFKRKFKNWEVLNLLYRLNGY
jgi:hypothetical protein